MMKRRLGDDVITVEGALQEIAQAEADGHRLKAWVLRRVYGPEVMIGRMEDERERRVPGSYINPLVMPKSGWKD